MRSHSAWSSPSLDQVTDAASGGEGRVERHPRLGPLVASLQLVVDVLLEALVVDVDKGGRECLVVVDQTLTNVEDVHCPTSP